MVVKGQELRRWFANIGDGKMGVHSCLSVMSRLSVFLQLYDGYPKPSALEYVFTEERQLP